MTKFEFEHREELERAAKQEEWSYMHWLNAEKAKGRDLQRNPITYQERAEFPTTAELALEEWDHHVVQIIPAPPNMTIRRLWTEETSDAVTNIDSPVICLALRRDGRIMPVEIDSESGPLPTSDPGIRGDGNVTILIDGKVHARCLGFW
jgi:hypothetical protein